METQDSGEKTQKNLKSFGVKVGVINHPYCYTIFIVH